MPLQQPPGGNGYIVNSLANDNVVDYYKNGSGNQPVAGFLNPPSSFSVPQGIASDAAGNIYVADSGGCSVYVYAPGTTTPGKTLNDPGNREPIDTAVASNGTVYVANISTLSGGPGNVSVYAAGATNPTSTLTDANFGYVIGVALNKKGDLYVSYVASNGTGSVAYYAKGSTTAQETGISIGFAGGIGFDAKGNLLLLDETNGVLDVFAPGHSTPTTQFTLPGAAAFFAFQKGDKKLFTADFVNASIDVFDYTPTSLTQIDKITNGITPSGNTLGITVSNVWAP